LLALIVLACWLAGCAGVGAGVGGAGGGRGGGGGVFTRETRAAVCREGEFRDNDI
jgi:hypothetical protein